MENEGPFRVRRRGPAKNEDLEVWTSVMSPQPRQRPSLSEVRTLDKANWSPLRSSNLIFTATVRPEAWGECDRIYVLSVSA